MPRAAASTSRTMISETAALVGLTSTARRTMRGTNSRRSSNRFDTTSDPKKLTPVRLPPGRARLETRPSLTGSSPAVNTMGIVAVADLAASAEGVGGRDDHRHLTTYQLRRQRRQPIV